MIDPDKILFIPSTRRGNGTGHLKRCLDWAAGFKTAHIYAAERGVGTEMRFRNTGNILWHDSPEGEWELLVLDNRETASLPESLSSVPLIAVDESGAIRSSASCTIDIIPGKRPGIAPNLQALSFMNVPERKHTPGKVKKILVCFGGEDPSALSFKLLDALKDSSEWSSLYKWHIISSSLVQGTNDPQWINIESPLPELRQVLPEYDLVLCSFGLTAFEALAAEVPVILFNPGGYHDRLSRTAGLSYIPRAWKKKGKLLVRGIRSYLERPGWLKEDCHALFERYRPRKGNLPEWLKGMQISRDACPACGSRERRALVRFENKSYFRCQACSMMYMVQFRKKTDIYGEEYFFSEYKAQYGKTYIEDFESIAVMGRDRLSFISRLGIKSGRLLDIGCAYGPFLREASSEGFASFGLEISPEAVSYINSNLEGITAVAGNIEEPDSASLFDTKFDVISFWYVIEHIQKLDEVLPRVASMLNPGGLLCLGTPCGRGISALKNRKEFLRLSPEDHYTVWTRTSARRILKRYGFQDIRFRSTGHHPERFPSVLCRILPFSLREKISRLFGLGDSFEIYATREYS